MLSYVGSAPSRVIMTVLSRVELSFVSYLLDLLSDRRTAFATVISAYYGHSIANYSADNQAAFAARYRPSTRDSRSRRSSAQST